MIYAVGDIHGQLGMLEAGIAHLLRILRPGDVVIFLGDYIDRGPDSAGVLRELIRFSKMYPATVFLRGNHEDLLTRAYNGDRRREEMWLLNGGFTTLASFGLGGDSKWAGKFPKWALDFIGATQIAVKSQRYHFVHAGVLPDGIDSGIERDLDYRLWVRGPFLEYGYSPGRIVVFGHTPQPDHRPLITQQKIGIDTGASQPGGRLTFAGFDDSQPLRRFPEFRLFQVLEDGTVTPDEMIRYGVSEPIPGRNHTDVRSEPLPPIEFPAEDPLNMP
jgi:serine/threonine protein phosphatase 1